MISIELLVKILGAIFGGAGFIWLVIRGFRAIRDKGRDNEKDIKTLQKKTDSHEKKLQEQENEMEAMEKRVDEKLEKKFAQLDEKIGKLSDNHSEMMSKISGIDGFIRGLNKAKDAS